MHPSIWLRPLGKIKQYFDRTSDKFLSKPTKENNSLSNQKGANKQIISANGSIPFLAHPSTTCLAFPFLALRFAHVLAREALEAAAALADAAAALAVAIAVQRARLTTRMGRKPKKQVQGRKAQMAQAQKSRKSNNSGSEQREVSKVAHIPPNGFTQKNTGARMADCDCAACYKDGICSRVWDNWVPSIWPWVKGQIVPPVKIPIQPLK